MPCHLNATFSFATATYYPIKVKVPTYNLLQAASDIQQNRP